MASRERKRAERRKRKERGLERRAEIAERYEERNREAREQLEPLEVGERPLVVSAGAVLSALICLSIVGAYVAGAEVNGERPRVLQVVAPAILMGVMAVGMWRLRYWAVLGFEAVLGLLLVAAVLGLTSAGSGVQLAGNLVLIAISGALFFFMIKAMARIQMPERPPRE
jgi:hypothetical protein